MPTLQELRDLIAAKPDQKVNSWVAVTKDGQQDFVYAGNGGSHVELAGYPEWGDVLELEAVYPVANWRFQIFYVEAEKST